MPFTHSKNARLFVDQWELTSFFNDFTMAAKAGTAETTVYGRGAKTFIGGLKEGQITAKGFFGAAVTDIEDSTLSNALGRQTNMAITFVPTGALAGGMAAGKRAVVSYAAETDLTITAPVTGVVATNFTAQADSGLDTGVILFDPTVTHTDTPPFTYNGLGENDTGAVMAATTVAAGSNGVNVNTFTGAGVLAVASTTGPPAFPSAGTIVVQTGSGPVVLTYTGTTTSSSTGVNNALGTSGVLATGGNVDQLGGSTSGLVANLHVLTLTGTGTPGITTAKIQHSMDNSTWVDLADFLAQANGGSPITAPGAFSAFVPYGTQIYVWLRSVLITEGTTISFAALVGAARQ
jgi:hypothetical protein